MVVFAGTAFENPVTDEYTLARSLLHDFFRCEGGSSEDSGKIDVEALQYVVSITCDEPAYSSMAEATVARSGVAGVDPANKQTLRLRVYSIRTKRAGGSKLPRVEVEEMGPRMDFRLGRAQHADEAMLKEAMRKGKTTEEKVKKNVAVDAMGDKLGRIHMSKQDLSELSLRKFKGLKRGRDVDDDGDVVMEEPAEASKKMRSA